MPYGSVVSGFVSIWSFGSEIASPSRIPWSWTYATPRPCSRAWTHLGSVSKVTMVALGAAALMAVMAGVLAPAITVLPARSARAVNFGWPEAVAMTSPDVKYGPAKLTCVARWTVIV